MSEEQQFSIHLVAPRQFEDVHDLQCLSLEGIQLGEHEIVVNLGDVRFMKPPATVGVLVFLEYILREYPGQRVAVAFPKDDWVIDYLAKIGFRSALEEIISVEWPSEKFLTGGIPSVRPMIPARRFSSPDDIETIANWMANIFQTELLGLGTLLQPCHTIFSEMADNAIQHAECGGGFVVAQEYWPRDARRMIELAIGDCGIGIRHALSKNKELTPRLISDEAAIWLALEDGVTSLIDRHRGYGLGHTKEEITRGRDRVLTIRSGAGWVRIYDNGDVRTGEYKESGKYKPVCGTIIHAVLPAGVE